MVMYQGYQYNGNVYLGSYYTIPAYGGYTITQGLPNIYLATTQPFVQYDLTNAVQVAFDVRTFNSKLGLLKDPSNNTIIDTSFNSGTGLFPNSSITISAAEFVAGMTAGQVISVGTYSTLYSDFASYVNGYFGYAGGFSSLFSTTSNFSIYNTNTFDANAFINIITEQMVDASGAYINQLTGTVTINNINTLLSYAVSNNPFMNRNGYTTISHGFLEGDIIYVPSGTTVTLNLGIYDSGVENIMASPNVAGNIVNVNGNTTVTGQTSNYSSNYSGSNASNYTETTTVTGSFPIPTTPGGNTVISRTLTAPLVFVLQNIS